MPPLVTQDWLSDETEGGSEIHPFPPAPELPEYLARGFIGDQGLVVHDGFVYWIGHDGDSAEIRGVAGAGGEVISLARLPVEPHAFAADESGFYLSDPLSGSVLHAPIGGGEAAPVLALDEAPLILVAHGAGVVIATAEGSVLEVPHGGEPVLLGELFLGGEPVAIAVDGNHAYVATDDGVLYRAARDLSGVSLLAIAERFADQIVVDGTHVYWLNDVDRAVKRVPIAGGPVAVLADKQFGPAGIAHDGGHIYFTTTVDDSVKRVGKSSGTVEVLIRDQLIPSEIAILDQQAFVFVNRDDPASILRFSK